MASRTIVKNEGPGHQRQRGKTFHMVRSYSRLERKHSPLGPVHPLCPCLRRLSPPEQRTANSTTRLPMTAGDRWQRKSDHTEEHSAGLPRAPKSSSALVVGSFGQHDRYPLEYSTETGRCSDEGGPKPAVRRRWIREESVEDETGGNLGCKRFHVLRTSSLSRFASLSQLASHGHLH